MIVKYHTLDRKAIDLEQVSFKSMDLSFFNLWQDKGATPNKQTQFFQLLTVVDLEFVIFALFWLML
jgi:hypothetical protein